MDTAGTGPKGAWPVYPNYQNAATVVIATLWHYDPEDLGWYVYGWGTVRGKRVVPEAERASMSSRARRSTRSIRRLAQPVRRKGGMAAIRSTSRRDCSCSEKTDLYLPDVISLALQRTYFLMIW